MGDHQLMVDQRTACLEQIGHSLDALMDALDRLAAGKGLVQAVIVGGSRLIVISVLTLLLWGWRLGGNMAALATCWHQLRSLPVNAFK